MSSAPVAPDDASWEFGPSWRRVKQPSGTVLARCSGGVILVGRLVTVGSGVLAGGLLLGGVVQGLTGHAATGVALVMGGLLAACGAELVARYTLVPRIVQHSTHLEVVNPWRTHRIPLGDVIDVRPGYGGTALITSRGRTVAWAVQKSNLAMIRGWRTRADRVAEQIRTLASTGSP